MALEVEHQLDFVYELYNKMKDNQVNLADLVIMKTQFLRDDCPACTNCLSYNESCTYNYECCTGCCCTLHFAGHCYGINNCSGIGGGCRAY